MHQFIRQHIKRHQLNLSIPAYFSPIHKISYVGRIVYSTRIEEDFLHETITIEILFPRKIKTIFNKRVLNI